MALLDSAAVFSARMQQLGLGDLVDKFQELGWGTLGNFAIAGGVLSANGSDEDKFMKKILIPLFQTITINPDTQEEEVLPVNDRRETAVRRLQYEAYMQFVSDMQRKTTLSDVEDKPKCTPAPERKARLDEVRDYLVGLEIEGELEPADSLVDKYVHMMESSHVLRYIPMHEVGRRDMEIKGKKKDEYFKPDANGLMRKHITAEEAVADCSNAYNLLHAFRRRGVALHMAKLLDYKVHDKLVRWYMKELHRDPLVNHKRIAIDQILRCDEEVWVRLAEETRGGLGLDPNTGDFVLDYWLPEVMKEQRIVALLNPYQLPAGSSRGSGDGAPHQKRERDSDPEKSQLREDLKRAKMALQKANKGGSSGSKGKGKGKSDKNIRGSSLPKELIGLEPTFNGKRLCFDFNLGKCSGSGKCQRGAHMCMRCGDDDHGATSSRCKKH